MELKALLQDKFQSEQSLMNGEASSPVNGIRQEAFKAFEGMEFPTIKHEEWKFTNVQKLVKNHYSFSQETKLSADEVSNAFIEGIEGDRIVFINGIFSEEHSSISASGLTVKSLAQAFKENKDVVEAHFGQESNLEESTFAKANTALSKDGIFIHVPKGKAIEKPISLYFLSDAKNEAIATTPRNLIVAEENSQVTVIEVFKTIGENQSLANNVTEISVANHAIVDYYKVQNEASQASIIDCTKVIQGKESHFTGTTISLKGDIIRNNLDITLDGEHLDSYMHGLYLLDGTTHVDNHTAVDHKYPNCHSNELYKGIVDDKSRGVFNGKIFVRQDAQKTNAFQNNRNIVLSDDAKVNTKPQLEIWADDVSCSHGCTIGQMDEEALFYLQARGISKTRSKAMLMNAFAGEVVEKIKVEGLRTYIETLIEERLHA